MRNPFRKTPHQLTTAVQVNGSTESFNNSADSTAGSENASARNSFGGLGRPYLSNTIVSDFHPMSSHSNMRDSYKSAATVSAIAISRNGKAEDAGEYKLSGMPPNPAMSVHGWF